MVQSENFAGNLVLWKYGTCCAPNAAAGATDVGPEMGVNAVFSVQSETSPEARARQGAPIRNGAVASAVLVHLRVEPAHFDWR